MKSLVLPALASLLVLGACQAKKTGPQTQPAAESIPVTLQPITLGASAQTISTTGLLATEEESKLAFKIGGVVESVMADEGDWVQAGQVLATLRSTEVAAQVNQTQLGVAKAQRDYERAQNLYNDSVATLEQLQNARTGLDIARQGLQAAQFNQQYARIYAPAAGFVVRRMLHPGEIAGPGMPVLVLNHVSGSSSWILRCGVTDAEWANIAEGNRALVELDAFPGKKLEAVVSKRSLTADMSNGSFSLELRVQLQGLKPAAGMYGRATIYTSQTTAASRIPYAALLEADGQTGYVFVPLDSARVQKRTIRLGRLYQNDIEVLDGLQGATHVVVGGNAYLSEQSRITIKK